MGKTAASIPRARSLPPVALPFAGLFVISGACGLTYEVVWTRMLTEVFGVTAFAVSTVLISFMGGLALGAALLGRRADAAARPLRMFALLEAGVGAYALGLPLLLGGVDRVYTWLFSLLPDLFLLRSAVRFVFCVVLLLVPTVLMGGTLPTLGQGLLRRREQVGLGVGLLYFVNTLGAAAGCYLAGFHLLPYLGLFRTTLLAAAFNGIVAGTAFVLDAFGRSAGARAVLRGEADAAEAGSPDGRALARPAPALTEPPSWPLWVAFGSGLAALAFEVVWFRVLVLVFGSTVYSFSAMLTVFLLGIALGSMLVGPWADGAGHPVRLLVAAQGAVAVCALGGSLAVNRMPALFLDVIRDVGLDFEGMNHAKFMLSSLVLLPAALAFGATFPVCVRLQAGMGGGTGSRIGRVYAWNTVGAILGSFGAGFLLLPTIGAEWTLRGVIGLGILLALGSILAEPGRLNLRWAIPAGLGLVLLAALLVLAPRWDRRLLGAGAYFEPRQFYDEQGGIVLDRVVADYELMTYTEGYNETIISFRSPKGKFITVNGSTTASDHFEDMFSQRMLGHLPAALHPGRPNTACIVGLGAGVTAGAIGLYDEVERLVALEIERGVFEASRFFEEENHRVLAHPGLDLRIDDGRNFLKLARDRFDLISSAPNFPSLTGSGALYSREFFQLCRERLAPEGVVCQFAPIWRLLPEDVKTIAASFADVFPHVRLFSTGLSLVMLGRLTPFPPVRLEEVERRVKKAEVAASLAGIGVRGPIELLSFYQMDEPEIRRWAAGAPRNTDDAPRIEFFAPRGVFSDTVGANLAEIASLRPSREERARRLGLEGDDRAAFLVLAAAYDATTEGEILLSRGKVEEAMERWMPAAESGQRYARYLVADWAEKTGLAFQRRGQLREARERFLLALRYEPDRLDALVNLGYVDVFLGNLEEAEQVLAGAVERYPRAAGAIERLGIVREIQGKRDEAEALYRRAVELQPALPEPHAMLGRMLLLRGALSHGLAEIEEAIRLGDAGEAVLLARVEALLALGRPKEALKRAREAVRSFPASSAALELLAKAAEATGESAEAQAARRRIGELGTREGAESPAAPNP